MSHVPKIKIESNSIINYDTDMDAYMPLIESETFSAINMTRVFGNSAVHGNSENNNAIPLMTSTPTRDNINISRMEEIKQEPKSISRDKSTISFSIVNSRPIKEENLLSNNISEQYVYQQNHILRAPSLFIKDDLYCANGGITSELRDNIVKMSRRSSGYSDDENKLTNTFNFSRRCMNSLFSSIGNHKIQTSQQSLSSEVEDSSMDGSFKDIPLTDSQEIICAVPAPGVNEMQENLSHIEQINETNTDSNSSIGIPRDNLFSVKERINFFNRIATKTNGRTCTFIKLLQQYNKIKEPETMTTRKFNSSRCRSAAKSWNNFNGTNSTSFHHNDQNNGRTILNTTFLINNSLKIIENVSITPNDIIPANSQLSKSRNHHNLCTISRQDNSNNGVKPSRCFIMEDLELVKPVKLRVAEYERLIKMKNK